MWFYFVRCSCVSHAGHMAASYEFKTQPPYNIRPHLKHTDASCDTWPNVTTLMWINGCSYTINVDAKKGSI